MSKFQAAVNIWDLSEESTKNLKVGNWVYAGDPSNKGVFLGVKKYAGNGSVVVVAWLHNAKNSKIGYHAYIKSLRTYAKGVS